MIADFTVEVVNKGTGEVIQVKLNTAHDVAEAYERVEQTLIAYRELRRQITDRGMQLLRESTR